MTTYLVVCPPAFQTAGVLAIGTEYTIVSVGTTDFTEIGAALNVVGVTFMATGAGSGTGTAKLASNQSEDPVADVQAVPLSSPPHVGMDAWGPGSPVLTGTQRGAPPDPHGKVYWGLTTTNFYVGEPPEGVNNPPEGDEWNEEQGLAALALCPDATVTEI